MSTEERSIPSKRVVRTQRGAGTGTHKRQIQSQSQSQAGDESDDRRHVLGVEPARFGEELQRVPPTEP